MGTRYGKTLTRTSLTVTTRLWKPCTISPLLTPKVGMSIILIPLWYLICHFVIGPRARLMSSWCIDLTSIKSWLFHLTKNLTCYFHIWKFPGNYPVFTVVMVICHYVEIIWRILFLPAFCITYRIINKYEITCYLE